MYAFLKPLFYSFDEIENQTYARYTSIREGKYTLHKVLINWKANSQGKAYYNFDSVSKFFIKGTILYVITANGFENSSTNYSIKLLDLTGTDIFQGLLENVNNTYTEYHVIYQTPANDLVAIRIESDLQIVIENCSPSSCGTISILLVT